MTLKQISVFCCLVTSLLQGCDSSHAIKVQQHTNGNAVDASISSSGKYSVISSLHHGVVVWDNDKHGLVYNWYQTPVEQTFSLFEDNNAPVDADNNFVLVTAISQDEKYAALANRHAFSLWKLSDGQNIGYWQIKKSTIRYDSSKQKLYDIVDKNKCIETQLNENEACKITSSIRALAVSNNGKQLALGKSDGVVTVVERKTGRRLEFLGHQQTLNEGEDNYHINNAINSLDISPNGKYVLSGSSDKSAYLWNSNTGQVIYKFQHTARVVLVKLDPKARYALTADSQKTAIIWDITTGKKITQLQLSKRQEVLTSANFSDNGKWLATGSPNRKISIWDTKSGVRLNNWQVSSNKNSLAPGGVVLSVQFVEQDSKIMSESSAGLYELWDWNNE